MHLSGRSLIGFGQGSQTNDSFRAFAPATDAECEPRFWSATPEEVDAAVVLAAEAFATYSRVSPVARANFLELIAAKVEAAQDQLTERANQETALPLPRLRGEIGRTCGQLRLFAQVVKEALDVSRHVSPQHRMQSGLIGMSIEPIVGGCGVQDAGAEPGQVGLHDVAHILANGSLGVVDG